MMIHMITDLQQVLFFGDANEDGDNAEQRLAAKLLGQTIFKERRVNPSWYSPKELVF